MAQFLIRQRIDLDKDNPVISYASALEYGSKNGHLWDAGIYQDDKPFDLSGHSAMGYFKRHDGNVVAVEGVCVGNSARVVLDEKCYAVPGRMDCLMMIAKGGTTVGVAALQVRVGSNLIGKMIDPGQLLPDNVSDLFAAIAAMNEATGRLNGALAAVKPWENVSASAESVAYGVQASATLSIVNGAAKFLFRVPKGKDGIDGRSFAINGIFPTPEELQAAHPVGSLGDAYIIGTPEKNTIYIWDADKSSWQNVGSLEAPTKPMPPMTILGNAMGQASEPQNLTEGQAWRILGKVHGPAEAKILSTKVKRSNIAVNRSGKTVIVAGGVFSSSEIPAGEKLVQIPAEYRDWRTVTGFCYGFRSRETGSGTLMCVTAYIDASGQIYVNWVIDANQSVSFQFVYFI